MAPRTIGEDDGVFLVGMFEVITNAFLFHEAGDEIESGFAVLDAIFAFRILTR